MNADIPKLRRQVAAAFIVALVFSLIIVGLMAQDASYREAQRTHCAQYEAIPQKYLDKVPSGCVPQWFEVNTQ